MDSKKVNTISPKWAEHNKKLDCISSDVQEFMKDSYFQKIVVWPFLTNTQVMHQEISFLLSHIDLRNKNILEVGGGFGNFCRCLHDRVAVKEYMMLDTKSMLRFSKSFLRQLNVPCEFIDSDSFETLFRTKFDVFISNICISELAEEYSNLLLDNVLPNCTSVFVIDSNKREFSSWLGKKLVDNFDEINFYNIPDGLTLQKDQKIYIGKNNG